MARSFLRDAEIEHTLRQMSDPILATAGIAPQSVRIFLINDDSINAFVAGGQNIFFHSGLLMQASHAEMLIGVIAHETGHISGAHLTQLSAASEEASIGALLSTVLGAAAVIGGAPQAGAAIISGGQNTAMRNLLSHYRGNEEQADQAAVEYLRNVGLSPAGMLDMFELLRRKERQHIDASTADPYLRTHPLTTDRISALRGEVERAGSLPAKPDAQTQKAFARMQAKLSAFLLPPKETLRRYPESAQDEAAHMARAVAYFKQSDITRALVEADALIALAPENGFSYEIKGQILFENGRIADAVRAYEMANAREPHNGLILTDLGKSYLAQENAQKAANVLEQATNLRHDSAQTYRQLAIAYGKLGQQGKSSLALAREAALQAKPKEMMRFATLAKQQAGDDSVLKLQAEDLIADAKRLEREQD